jgi:hypothetical protein
MGHWNTGNSLFEYGIDIREDIWKIYLDSGVNDTAVPG